MENDSDKSKLNLEIQKLELEIERIKWEQEKNTAERFIAASDRQRLKLEKDKFDLEKQGHILRAYAAPFASVFIAFLVLVSSLYFNDYQKQAKNAEIQLASLEVKIKENELVLANKKAQDEFNDIKRKELIDSARKLDEFWGKHESDLASKTMSERKSIADRLLQLFSTTSLNLIIDYFRSYRDKKEPKVKPSDEDTKCADNWEDCKDN